MAMLLRASKIAQPSNAQCLAFATPARLFSSNGTPSDGDGSSNENSTTQDRGAMVKGSFHEFLKKLDNSDTSAKQGLFSKLGRDISGAKQPSFLTRIPKRGIDRPRRTSRSGLPDGPVRQWKPKSGSNNEVSGEDSPLSKLLRNRSLNNRLTGQRSGKFSRPASSRDGTSGDSRGGFSHGPRRSNSRKKAPRNSDGGQAQPSDSGSIPPEISAMLADTEFFEDIVKNAGKSIDTREMDGLDALLAESLYECCKTEDGTYRKAIVSDALLRTAWPQARSMLQLQAFMKPDVRSVEHNTEGYELAKSAWGAIHQNYYYTDEDKLRMMEGIATWYNKVQAYQKKLEEEDAHLEVIFKPGFCKGRGYLNEQMRRNEIDSSTLDFYTYKQEETDWNVTAVVDEDEL